MQLDCARLTPVGRFFESYEEVTQVQDRGLAAYVAELIGTLLLVFFITSVVALYVSDRSNAQFGSDFAVVGLSTSFVLFALIISIGVASGGHFNPAVTARSS